MALNMNSMTAGRTFAATERFFDNVTGPWSGALSVAAQGTGTPFAALPGNAILAARDWILAFVDAHRTRSELQKLSPEMLDDIGLCASDIDRIARRGY